MLAIPSFLAPATVGARLLNKLLAREDWARQRLSQHAGKTVRFALAHITAALTLQADGYVQPSDPAITPDVTLTVPANKLGQLAVELRSNNSDAIADLMHVQGEAGLARVVSDLARELRWDVEEDLAGMVGDVAALRLVKGIKSLVSTVKVSVDRLAGNVGEYLSEESRLLAGRDAYEQWRIQLRMTHERLDALEQRVWRLGGARTAHRSGRGA